MIEGQAKTTANTELHVMGLWDTEYEMNCVSNGEKRETNIPYIFEFFCHPKKRANSKNFKNEKYKWIKLKTKDE